MHNLRYPRSVFSAMRYRHQGFSQNSFNKLPRNWTAAVRTRHPHIQPILYFHNSGKGHNFLGSLLYNGNQPIKGSAGSRFRNDHASNLGLKKYPGLTAIGLEICSKEDRLGASDEISMFLRNRKVHFNCI